MVASAVFCDPFSRHSLFPTKPGKLRVSHLAHGKWIERPQEAIDSSVTSLSLRSPPSSCLLSSSHQGHLFSDQLFVESFLVCNLVPSQTPALLLSKNLSENKPLYIHTMFYKLKHPLSIWPNLNSSLNSPGKADSAEFGVLSHHVRGLAEVTGSSPLDFMNIQMPTIGTWAAHVCISLIPQNRLIKNQVSYKKM